MTTEKEIIENKGREKVEIRKRKIRELIIRKCNETTITITDDSEIESVCIRDSYIKKLTIALPNINLTIRKSRIKDALIAISEGQKNTLIE